MGLFTSKSNVEEKGSNADGFGEYVDTLVSDVDSADIALVAKGNVNSSTRYGIDNTIKLLRQLPIDNPKVVVKIVRQTLESVDIDVSVIITDANNKVSLLEQHIDSLSSEIEHLEQQIAQKKEEILGSNKDLDETFKVRDLLEEEQATLEKKSAIKNDNQSVPELSEIDVKTSNNEPSSSTNDENVKDIVNK